MRFELAAIRQIHRMCGNIVDRGRAIVGRRRPAERRILLLADAAGGAGVGGCKRQQAALLLLAPQLLGDRGSLARSDRHHRSLGTLRHIANGITRRPLLGRSCGRRRDVHRDLRGRYLLRLWCFSQF